MTEHVCTECGAMMTDTILGFACVSCSDRSKTTDPRPAEMGIILTQEQEAAVATLEEGRSVLLTGVAGTGKTTALNAWLGRTQKYVARTASTGIAATHLGGMTVHRWSGIGICERSAGSIVEGDYWRECIAPEIRAVDALVIDEVSMLDARAFDLLSEVCQEARGSTAPFGGLQLILVGDFGQLAPVEVEEHGYPFETRTWWDTGIDTVTLTKVMRTADAWYVWLLQCIREGFLPPEAEKILRARTGAYDPDVERAARLMTHNDQADRLNERKLGSDICRGPVVQFDAEDSGDPILLDILNKNCLSPRFLRLREGARVMLTRNHPGGLWVNGTLGEVVSLDATPSAERIVVRLDDGPEVEIPREEWKLEGHPDPSKAKGRRAQERAKVPPRAVAFRLQFPLRLAWAVTIHKSQGMTLSRVSADLGACFAPGQAYVALSRARSLFGLNIERWPGRRCIITHPTALRFMRGEYVLPTADSQAPATAEENRGADADDAPF